MLYITSFLSAPPRRLIGRTSLASLLLMTLSLLWSASSQADDANLFRPLPADTASLDQFKWKSRPLVIFAPSQSDPHYIQQINILEKVKAELKERDIVVLSDTSPSSNGELRSQLNPKGFEVVLVGKDGGMKLRQQKPISSEVLLSTIDNMPMRKAKL